MNYQVVSVVEHLNKIYGGKWSYNKRSSSWIDKEHDRYVVLVNHCNCDDDVCRHCSPQHILYDNERLRSEIVRF